MSPLTSSGWQVNLLTALISARDTRRIGNFKFDPRPMANLWELAELPHNSRTSVSLDNPLTLYYPEEIGKAPVYYSVPYHEWDALPDAKVWLERTLEDFYGKIGQTAPFIDHTNRRNLILMFAHEEFEAACRRAARWGKETVDNDKIYGSRSDVFQLTLMLKWRGKSAGVELGVPEWHSVYQLRQYVHGQFYRALDQLGLAV